MWMHEKRIMLLYLLLSTCKTVLVWPSPLKSGYLCLRGRDLHLSYTVIQCIIIDILFLKILGTLFETRSKLYSIIFMFFFFLSDKMMCRCYSGSFDICYQVLFDCIWMESPLQHSVNLLRTHNLEALRSLKATRFLSVSVKWLYKLDFVNNW